MFIARIRICFRPDLSDSVVMTYALGRWAIERAPSGIFAGNYSSTFTFKKHKFDH